MRADFPLHLLIVLLIFNYAAPLTYPILTGKYLSDLYGTTSADLSLLANNWTVTNPVSGSTSRVGSCGSLFLMGGSNLLGTRTTLTRIYSSLPSHTYISYKFDAIKNNAWASTASDSIAVYIDGTLIQTLSPGDSWGTTTGLATCGHSQKDFPYYYIVGVQAHSSTSSINITIVVSNTNYASCSWGLSGVGILFRSATPYYTSQACYNMPTTLSAPCSHNGNQYKDTSGNIQTCDSSCDVCFGPGAYSCFTCTDAYFFDGSNCLSCAANCLACTGSSANQCSRCASGYYLQMDNNTCTSACNSPYTSDGSNAYMICQSPCPTGQYYFYDPATSTSTCRLNCTSPYTVVNTGSATQSCILCTSSQYRAYNTSGEIYCSSNCTSPNQVRNTSYCTFCPLGQYIFYTSSGQQTCTSNCTTAPYQIMSNIYCLICDVGEYISYDTSGNQICVTSCSSPYQVMNSVYCLICPLNKYISYDSSGNQICVSNCTTSPYQVMNNNMYCLICPLNRYISYNSSGNQICVISCSSPYQVMNSVYCLICPLNKYISYNSSGNQVCVGNCTTSPYQVMNNNMYCLICPLGQYISYDTSGQRVCVNNCITSPFQVMNSIYCLICPLGQYISYNTSGQQVCVSNCTTSPYQVMHSIYCLVCDLGQYIYYDNSTGRSSCVNNCTSPNSIVNNIYCVSYTSANSVTGQSSSNVTNNNTTNSSTNSEKPVSAAIRDNIGLAASIVLVIASFLGSSNPGTFFIAAVFKILSYVKFIRIDYPDRLQAMLDSISSALITFNFFPSIPDEIENLFELQTIPSNFAKYDLHSSFFVNYWGTLISLSTIGTLIIVLLLIQHLVRRYEEATKLLKQLVQVYKWNFFLIVFCSNFDQIILYTSLDLRTLHLTQFTAVASFLLAITALCGAVYVIVLMVRVIRQVLSARYKVGPDKEDQQIYNLNKWRQFQLFFRGYKDNKPIQKYFMLIYITRLGLFYATVAYLFDYPLIQTVFLLVLSFSMLSFMIVIQPFESWLVRLQYTVDEFCILIINICILTLAIFDRVQFYSNIRDVLGDTVIFVSIAESIWDTLCCLAYIYYGVKNAYANTKRYKALGIVSWVVIMMSPYESGGMDVDLVHHEEKLSARGMISNSQPIGISSNEYNSRAPWRKDDLSQSNNKQQSIKRNSHLTKMIRQSFMMMIPPEDSPSSNTESPSSAKSLQGLPKNSNRGSLIQQQKLDSSLTAVDVDLSMSHNHIGSADMSMKTPVRRSIIRKEFEISGLIKRGRRPSNSGTPLRIVNRSNFSFSGVQDR